MGESELSCWKYIPACRDPLGAAPTVEEISQAQPGRNGWNPVEELRKYKLLEECQDDQ